MIKHKANLRKIAYCNTNISGKSERLGKKIFSIFLLNSEPLVSIICPLPLPSFSSIDDSIQTASSDSWHNAFEKAERIIPHCIYFYKKLGIWTSVGRSKFLKTPFSGALFSI